MRLYERRVELSAIKTICTQKPSAMKLFGNLKEDHFHNSAARAAFKRLKKVVERRSEVLSWDSLLEDGVIDEQHRLVLKGVRDLPTVNARRCQEIFDNLDGYRKIREIYYGVKDIPEELEAARQLDVDRYIEQLTRVVDRARSAPDDDNFFIFGKDNNVDAIVDRILSPDGFTVLPTGFKAFDNVNRGIKLGSVVFMGATTSGFKSLLSKIVVDNMAETGAKVCFCSLEMDEDEMFMRDLARISHTSMEKLFDPDKITDEERRHVKKMYRRKQEELAKRNINIHLKVPKGNPSIEELLVQLKPYDFDVICIDYISLLKGVNEEEQWKKLGAITAFAKTFARNNKCIVILLGQVSAEAKIRYSGGILENVDVAWIWIKDQTVIDTKILTVDCVKARQQKTFKFKVYADPEFATICDIPEGYKPPIVQTTVKDVNTKKKTKSHDAGNDNSDDLMKRYFGGKNKKAA